MRVSVVVLLVVAPGCKKVTEAPEDVDGLLHGLWGRYDDPEDPDGAGLASLFVAASEVIDLDALSTAWVDGAQTPLTDAEQALVALGPSDTPRPIADAVPLYTLSRYACDLLHQEQIQIYHDQNELFDVYDDYRRDYVTDIDAYDAGDDVSASWTGEIVATIPTLPTYTYTFHTDLRRLVLPDDHPSAGAPALVSRTYMVAPATWDAEGPRFEQDYQIEAWFPHDGDVVHVYGVWRQMELGWMGDMTDTVVARTTINQMNKWDKRVVELCEEGEPASSPF